MTATNHVMAGAVIALTIQRPILILPLAVLSHFILDAVPHFGIHAHDAFKRNKNRIFLGVLGVDILVTIVLLVAVPFGLHADISPWVILLGMLMALAPDVIWTYRFVHEVRTKTEYPFSSWFARFHTIIQWYEKPPGIVVEVVALAILVWAVITLV